MLALLQAFPPLWAAVTIVLVLSCNPFPQDLEHFDHPPQEDHLQCTEKINEHIFTLRFLQIFFLLYLDTLADYKIFGPVSCFDELKRKIS